MYHIDIIKWVIRVIEVIKRIKTKKIVIILFGSDLFVISLQRKAVKIVSTRLHSVNNRLRVRPAMTEKRGQARNDGKGVRPAMTERDKGNNVLLTTLLQ